MWMFLVVVSLLDLNQAALLPGKHGGLQLTLQQQIAQTAVTPAPGGAQQSSSSSSSSSSSESSESSQTSEDVQMLKEPQKLENTAGEQVDLFQESSEVLVPTSQTSSTNLQLSELVLLGQKANGDRERGAEDEEDQDKAVPHTYHPLLSLNEAMTHTPNVTEEFAEGGVSTNHVGGAREQEETGDDAEADEEKVDGLTHLSDDSMEEAHGLTHHLPRSHGDEAGLELAL